MLTKKKVYLGQQNKRFEKTRGSFVPNILQLAVIATVVYIATITFQEQPLVDRTIYRANRIRNLNKSEDRYARIIKHALDIIEITFEKIQTQNLVVSNNPKQKREETTNKYE